MPVVACDQGLVPPSFELPAMMQPGLDVLLGGRRLGDLNPGWDHSQTALAVRRFPCHWAPPTVMPF